MQMENVVNGDVSNHCQEDSIFKAKYYLGAGSAHKGCEEGMGNKVGIDGA